MSSSSSTEKRPGQARLTVRADDDAMTRARDFVTAFAADEKIGDDDRARILIVIEEIVTNIVKYGYAPGVPPGLAELTLDHKDGRVEIEIADDGLAFDPFDQPGPDLDASVEDRPVGRLGIHIVKALTDEALYARVDNRNVVRLTRHLARPIPGARR
jgi:anti-sigma regulatory factor (Ser/Thr protein kinase)